MGFFFLFFPPQLLHSFGAHSPLHPSCDPGLAPPARMPSALWSSLPVVLGLLLWHPAGASGLCWESSKCQDLASEASVLVSLGTGTALQLLSFLTLPRDRHGGVGEEGDGDAVTVG